MFGRTIGVYSNYIIGNFNWLNSSDGKYGEGKGLTGILVFDWASVDVYAYISNYSVNVKIYGW